MPRSRIVRPAARLGDPQSIVSMPLEPATPIAADTGLRDATTSLPSDSGLGGTADSRVSQPPSLPTAASNAAILKLGKLMPVGTPVTPRSNDPTTQHRGCDRQQLPCAGWSDRRHRGASCRRVDDGEKRHGSAAAWCTSTPRLATAGVAGEEG